ncbi:EamA family transporter [Magnetospirillum aberrantis]|uniref:EamA family transporter n=1 Tax=Magnetospirillum aberrantis SpK TaxID=908842 RepID=A0A7C9US21_9PROT|nr:EamA family transporter [Magnetospirillum aberrantis]NFV78987.1 EamA family transporter [Magnetospirillum aberrantis SpK]
MSTTISRVAWGDVLMTAIAPMLWGSTYLVTTQMLPPDRPFVAAALRAVPAGVVVLAVFRRWPDRDVWGRLLLLSALNIGVFQALLFVAAYRLPGGLAAVVGAIQPLLVLALAWVVERARPRFLSMVGGVVGVVGMAVLLVSPEARWDAIGIGAALGGAACMAAGTYLARRWRIGLPVMAATGWQLLLGGIMIVPLAVMVDPPLPPLTMLHVAGYVYLSAAGAVLAYGLWFRGVVRLPAAAVSSLGLLSPLTAIVLGWGVLGQAVGVVGMVGMALVLAGIVAVQHGARS